jgi:hypothetical protein
MGSLETLLEEEDNQLLLALEHQLVLSHAIFEQSQTQFLLVRTPCFNCQGSHIPFIATSVQRLHCSLGSMATWSAMPK